MKETKATALKRATLDYFVSLPGFEGNTSEEEEKIATVCDHVIALHGDGARFKDLFAFAIVAFQKTENFEERYQIHDDEPIFPRRYELYLDIWDPKEDDPIACPKDCGTPLFFCDEHDFFQVIKQTAKTVTIRPVRSEQFKEGSEYFIRPIPYDFSNVSYHGFSNEENMTGKRFRVDQYGHIHTKAGHYFFQATEYPIF